MVWIYCEGKTEEQWALHLRSLSEAVAIHAFGQQGVPRSVVDKAARRRRQLRATIASRDEVWAVFDQDEHPTADALHRAGVLGIGVAFSNPCFELWPLLHLVEHTAFVDRRQCQRKLHDLHRTYHHERHPYVRWEVLEKDHQSAVGRCLTLHRRGADAGDPSGNPSSGAWMLRERVAAGEDPVSALVDRFRALPLEHDLLEGLVRRLAEPTRSRVWRELGGAE